MSPPTLTPQYLYKIVPLSTPPPTPLPSILPLSPLDANDGFIHLSTSSQILGTLNRFFAADSHVHVLRIPYERVERFLKWETPEGKEALGFWTWQKETEFYPHIYGNTEDGKGIKLGSEEVLDEGKWVKSEESWRSEEWPFGEDEPVQ